MPPKGWIRARRGVAYKAPPPSRWQRFHRTVFNVWTVSAVLFLGLGIFLTMAYFWFEFSDRIDRRLLAGDVFTATAGIYSAPKTLRAGEAISKNELIEYLRSAGYIERNDQADASRSRYAIEGDVVGIEPGITAFIDGRKSFPSISVKFSKDGKSVEAIGDRDSGQQVREVLLEPKILSSIAAEGDGRRKTVTFNDLPPHLVQAIITTEDRAFFDHYGVNFRGIARALWRRYEGDDGSPIANQGGSSITQQLVKNLFLTREQTIQRKLTEAYMSLILETRLSKQEIFTLYANQIYLGQQTGVAIYGVGEAANTYFGKDVSQLTLPEAAFIAGMIRSPNRYSPYKDPQKAKDRRNQVLSDMLEEGQISQTEFAQAREEDIRLKHVSNTRDLQGMPYFTQHVVDQLPKVINDPEALQHLRVYTSIDPDLQRIAYETVAKRLTALDRKFPKKTGLNASLVAVRPKTGEIVAMIGGRDYLENQFNRATDALRQPGSVFKPFVYMAAINSAYDSGTRQFTAASIFKDERKTFTYGNETYSPGNFGDYFSNQNITLRDALVKSKNVIAVDVAMQLNIGRVMNLAAKAGLPKVEKAYPSMALGTAEATPLQVATGYTTFANLGDRTAPMPITRITSGDGRTVNQAMPDKKNVVRPDVAYIMNDMMKDVINRGTAAQLGGWGFRNEAGKRAFAGKTGTSRDGWFAGFTPEIVCVVYVGFDNGDDLGMKGSDSAMPIWADFMKEALRLHPEYNGDWTMPANVRKAEIDIRNGSLIRELDTTPTPEATPLPSPSIDPELQKYIDPEPTPPVEVFVTNVPAEFRRVEYFVAGTVPNRALLPADEAGTVPMPNPDASATPVTQSWQDASEGRTPPPTPEPDDNEQPGVTVSVCFLTGMRATVNCRDKESRSFKPGTEPKEFCTFHR